MVERGLEPNAHPSAEPDLEDDVMLELDPEVLAFMIAAEANTFYKSRGATVGWKKPTRGMGGADLPVRDLPRVAPVGWEPLAGRELAWQGRSGVPTVVRKGTRQATAAVPRGSRQSRSALIATSFATSPGIARGHGHVQHTPWSVTCLRGSMDRCQSASTR